MNSSNEQRHYLAYLLRLWRTGDDEAAVWRVLLEDPRTGERRGFADLESLLVFLYEVCRENGFHS